MSSPNLVIKVDAFWDEKPGDGGKCFNAQIVKMLKGRADLSLRGLFKRFG